MPPSPPPSPMRRDRPPSPTVGTRFTDLGSGYDAYRRSSLPALDLPGTDLPGRRHGHTVWGDSGEIEPMINIRMAAQGLGVVEAGSVGYPRVHGNERRRVIGRAMRALRRLIGEYRRRSRLGRRPSAPARHDATNLRRYAETTGPRRPAGIAQRPGPPVVRPPAPDPAPYAAGERSTGRHASRGVAAENSRVGTTGGHRDHAVTSTRTTPEPGTHRAQDVADHDTAAPYTGVRRSGIYNAGTNRLDSGVHRTGVYDTGVRRSGLYDTGVHRVGVYDSGVHRTDVYESGAHRLPNGADPGYRQSLPREVGGGRRRLDARDRRQDRRPDLTVIAGDGGHDAGRTRESRSRRPGHLRAVPSERSSR